MLQNFNSWGMSLLLEDATDKLQASGAFSLWLEGALIAPVLATFVLARVAFGTLVSTGVSNIFVFTDDMMVLVNVFF